MNIKTYISSGVIEAYVLGTISQEESAILECVIKNNSEVKAAVLEAQQTIEKLATLQAIQPPNHLKEEIRKKISFGNNNQIDGKIIPLTQNNTTVSQNLSLPVWMKAASIAVLFGLGYLGYLVNSKNTQLQEIAQNNSSLQTKITSLEQMNSLLMNSKKIELKGVEKHPNMLAEVYISDGNKVYLNPKNLPSAPSGKQYQLWAIVDGKPVDMGVYDAKKGSTIQAMKSVSNAQAFAITLEKEGGNATPTMEEMYVMGTI